MVHVSIPCLLAFGWRSRGLFEKKNGEKMYDNLKIKIVIIRTQKKFITAREQRERCAYLITKNLKNIVQSDDRKRGVVYNRESCERLCSGSGAWFETWQRSFYGLAIPAYHWKNYSNEKIQKLIQGREIVLFELNKIKTRMKSPKFLENATLFL